MLPLLAGAKPRGGGKREGAGGRAGQGGGVDAAAQASASMAATRAGSGRPLPSPASPAAADDASRPRRRRRVCHGSGHGGHARGGGGWWRRLAVAIAAAAVAASATNAAATTAAGRAAPLATVGVAAAVAAAAVAVASAAAGVAAGAAGSLLRPPGAPHPPSPAAPSGAPSRYGAATCLSADGTALAVGAPSAAAFRGAVWVYTRRRPGGLRASAAGATVGAGVDADAAVWGTPVAVSLPGTDAAEANRPAGSLTPPVRGSAAGYACAWTARGGLAVGAPGHESGRGGVWVVPAPPEGGWSAGGGGGGGAVATALPLPEDSRSGDAAGSTMAADGDVLVVGARGVRGHHGRVVVYERTEEGGDGDGDCGGDGGWGAPTVLSPPD